MLKRVQHDGFSFPLTSRRVPLTSRRVSLTLRRVSLTSRRISSTSRKSSFESDSKSGVWNDGHFVAELYSQSHALSRMWANASSPSLSSAENRAFSGLSMSKTPTTAPLLSCRGTTISDAEALSQAI